MSELSKCLPSNIAALLDAVAEEIALSAREISELGEIVFADNTIGDRHTRLRKLEAFGLLRDKSVGNACLVQAIAFAIEAPACDHASLFADAIAAVPFPPARERLEAALKATTIDDLREVPESHPDKRASVSDKSM